MADSPLSPGMGLGNILGGAAALGGLAYTLSKGPDKLPGEAQVVENTYAPTEWSQGQTLFNQGETLVGQGTTGIARAQAGKLTPQQQAQLDQMRNNETNQAYQMYEQMGRTPTRDTSFLGTEQAIDRDTMAAAQSFIDTNIKLATGELSAGQGFITAGAGFEGAASTQLLDIAGKQMKLSEDYNNAVAQAFANTASAFAGTTSGKGTPININMPSGGTPAPA